MSVSYFRWTSWACAVATGLLVFASLLPAQAPGAAPGQQPAENMPGAKAAQEVAPPQNARAYREVVDETGRTVRIRQPVERIVSLAPNLTETVYALGLQDRLVGDTDYCDYPAAAQKKQKVGGTINPSIEEVATLRPDVVLMASVNRFETVRALEGLNIPVYGTDPHNVQEILSSTIKLADVLGAAQNGVALANELQQRLTDLQGRIGELPAKRVLFVVWTEPLITIGKNTFIADALRKAGAVSIVDTALDWPQVSLEEIVNLQPDFLVFTLQNDEKAPDLLSLSTRPGWRSLEAVRNHRFVVVSDAVNRPAPRLISAIEDMARQLHPEAFADSPGVQPPASKEPLNKEPSNNQPSNNPSNNDKLDKPTSAPGKVPPSPYARLRAEDADFCVEAGAFACNR